MISMDHDPESNYLITSPTYRLLNQSILPIFFRFFSGLGLYRAGDSLFKLNDGRTIFIRSMNNPNSVEGIPRVKYSWNDEAGLLSNRAWQNIETRLATADGRAMNTSTPYKLGGWYHEAYQAWVKGQNPDWDWIVWRSVDNPHISHDEIEKLKARLPSSVYRMKYEASFENPMGLVYALDSENWCEPFKLDSRYKIYVGLDFGFSISATAIVIIAQNVQDKVVYVIYENKKTHVSIGDLVEHLRQLKKIYHFEEIWADSAAPQLIFELVQAGLPVRGATKGAGSVDAGILQVQSLFQTHKLKIFNHLTALENELYTYAWDEKSIGGVPKVIKSNDDLCDALSYVIRSFGGQHYVVPGSEFKPQLTHLEQANRDAELMDRDKDE